MRRVLYTGSFDPITKGHMDIINQACTLFDEVVVGVLVNNKKTPLFSVEERLEMIKELYKDNNQVYVISDTKAAIDVALENNCIAIIRGLRSLTDFDYEIGMSNINKQLSDNKINTVCLFADKEYQYISSSMVKEVFNLDKDISLYVDDYVKGKMKVKKYGNKNTR